MYLQGHRFQLQIPGFEYYRELFVHEDVLNQDGLYSFDHCNLIFIKIIE